MRNLQLSFIILIMTAAGAGAAPGGHEEPDCRQCHMRGAGVAAAVGPSAADCRACHRDQFLGRDDRLGFHGPAARDRCLDCHSFHDPTTVQTSRGLLSLPDLAAVDPGHCRTCHDGAARKAAGLDGRGESLLGEAHLAAATLYHENAATLAGLSPSEACLQCHGDESATTWQARTRSVLSFPEHASHPSGVRVLAGQGPSAGRIRAEIDPDIPLYSGRMECQTCHDLTAGRPDLVRSEGPVSRLCLGCHDFPGGRKEPSGTLRVARSEDR